MIESRIYVRAKAHAHSVTIAQQDETHFTISVTEPAEAGKANEAIRRVLADYMRVPPTSLSLHSGQRSSHKVFILHN
ncbi:MAG: DUF167 domain-containing protein [Candidatus Kerfeldbacteria bacterium]|nr:DUF167 domain-containing protein [Candidatus Kerfeldbacteria bacterium]